MPEIVLLRHTETEWSRDGKHTGRTDIPLTDHGREIAAALAPRFEGREFALVLCSPLSRARDTAALAGLPEPTFDDDLMEWDYGDYEGITTAEIRESRPDWYLWRDGVPGGEHAADVAARCDRVIQRVLPVDGDVCLVAHGHLLRVLGARWLEQPPELGGRLWLETGAVCTLGWEREVRVLRGWNL